MACPTWRPRKPWPCRRRARGAQAFVSLGGGSVIDTCKALKLLGRYLVRAVEDAVDREARGQVMWAATLAGIAFGNAGVHAPHGMSYAVAGSIRDFHPAGYPDKGAIVPHGMSVMVNAPCTIGRDELNGLFRDALSYW